MSCNINDCENGAEIVYCPNRFTFEEMCNIKMALMLAPGIISEFIETSEYKTLCESEKVMFKEGPRIAKEMSKLEIKVDMLLDL